MSLSSLCPASCRPFLPAVAERRILCELHNLTTERTKSFEYISHGLLFGGPWLLRSMGREYTNTLLATSILGIGHMRGYRVASRAPPHDGYPSIL